MNGAPDPRIVAVSVVVGAAVVRVAARPALRHDARRRGRVLRGAAPRPDDATGAPGSPVEGFWGAARRWPRAVQAVAFVVRVASGLTARRRRSARRAELERAVPVAIDLMSVAVGAGCTPYLALEVATRWAPPPAAAPLEAVLRSWRLGAPLPEALGAVTAEPLRPLADTLASSDRLGAPLGATLERLSAGARADARRRAEARARTLPVRMLFPLVFLVLPAFGLLTVVPALLAGLPR